MAAIELENLYKAHHGAFVIQGLSLTIEPGETYGLLGAEGAGKTTLLHMLLGLQRPQRGSLRVLGTTNLGRNIGRVGYLPQQLQLQPAFSGAAHLQMLGKADGMRGPLLAQRTHEALERVGLLGAAHHPVENYTLAMRQRLGLAQALLGQPALLLLDMPAARLADDDRRSMLALLASLREHGVTALIASDHPDDLAHTCDRVGILHRGRIAAEAELAALGALAPSVRIAVGEIAEITAERLARLSSAVQISPGAIDIDPNTQQLQARVLKILVDAQIDIYRLEPQVGPLAALFRRVLGGEDVGPAFTPRADMADETEQAPPNSLFAPPGHPDTLEQAQAAPAHEGETVAQELPSEEKHELL
ncbi:ABC transporter ATP-binding protein [Chloroflexia bacterium SDU3-3]|nr:ABC transporter ATP-binding protein [Chloroflexia bacterium SDU3-3]